MVATARGVPCYGYVIKDSGDFVLESSIAMAFELFDMHEKMHAEEERHRTLVEWSPYAIVVHRN